MNAGVLGKTLSELRADFRAAGVSEHQARLTFQALHRFGLREPAEMPEISAICRDYLKSQAPVPQLRVDTVHEASDGTLKLRILTSGGEAVEAVLIPARQRVTLCLSSQVGCAAGCGFCHTATMGLLRNLQAWEIIEQFRLANQHAPRPITNVVFMGMGEPLHNEANVLQACRILTEPVGVGLSRRHVVVSTAGVGSRIRPFWDENVASLALSLHATTDATRDQIVPLNRQWNLAALRQILLDIPWRNKEFVVVAYLLLDGVNDTRADAERLAEWTRGLPVKVNLLEFNPFPGSHYQRASTEKRDQFRAWLDEFNVFHTLRVSRGDDVLAACGQLATPSRRKHVRQ